MSYIIMQMNSPTCSDCGVNISQNKGFCQECSLKHSQDIVEIIRVNGETLYDNNLEEAEKDLMSMYADLRLDLHDTLDTLDNDVRLPLSLTTCCISFVGRYSDTRIMARHDIQNRIRNGQILFGVLIFKRNIKKTPYTVPGSKAWTNQLIQSKNPLFIDDGKDHVESVQHIGVPSIQIIADQSLQNLILNYYQNGSNNGNNGNNGDNKDNVVANQVNVE